MMRNESVGTKISVQAFAVKSAATVPVFPAAYNKNVSIAGK
jgi:hypothetical protein